MILFLEQCLHLQRGCLDLVALDGEDVAGGDLFQVGVCLGIQVHDISIPGLLCRQLRDQHLQEIEAPLLHAPQTP